VILARTPQRSGKRAAPPALMMTVRRLHLYIGLFIAPSILFFAFSGSLQLFSLHEAHGSYRPPVLIEKLGSLHKDQRFTARARRPVPAAAGKPAAAEDADHDRAGADHDHADAAPAPAAAKAKASDPKALASKPFKEQALKWLFLAVAVGLLLSTSLGVWMGLTFARSKVLAWILLLAGAALPVLLVVL
jgi:hypothetical protein